MPATNGNGASAYSGPTTPAVKRLAREHGVDLAAIAGTGHGGRSTPGHELWTVRDGYGADVGILWVAHLGRRPGHAFIYDIWIAPDRRGEGFGSGALAALEEWAHDNGITSIGLHVFGNNEGARRLYRRFGYVETNVQMEKQL